ncbi:hypothetical protein H721_02788 [Brucella ovis IntaBari-2006-46-332]|nr:hypothetical protein H721_02788 [Brucella ovis IntaBari-2006-46-332]
MTQHNRRLDAVLAIALIAFALLPWYRIEDGFLHFSWIEVLFSESAEAPGILQIFVFGRSWIGAIALLMLICAVARFFLPVGKRSGVLIAASLVGFIFLACKDWQLVFPAGTGPSAKRFSGRFPMASHLSARARF